jgi:hypothetical protein
VKFLTLTAEPIVIKSRTDILLPCLRLERKDTVLLISAESMTLRRMQLPMWHRPATLHVLPICTKDLKLMDEPISAKSSTLKALPHLTPPRILTVEEKKPKLSVEICPPIFIAA